MRQPRASIEHTIWPRCDEFPLQDGGFELRGDDSAILGIQVTLGIASVKPVTALKRPSGAIVA